MSKLVLTVDDSRTMRDMLKLALNDAAFTVVQAVDGAHGLEWTLPSPAPHHTFQTPPAVDDNSRLH